MPGHGSSILDLGPVHREQHLGVRDLSGTTGAPFQLGKVLLHEEQECVALKNTIRNRAAGDDRSIDTFLAQDVDAQMTVRRSHEIHEVGD